MAIDADPKRAAPSQPTDPMAAYKARVEACLRDNIASNAMGGMAWGGAEGATAGAVTGGALGIPLGPPGTLVGSGTGALVGGTAGAAGGGLYEIGKIIAGCMIAPQGIHVPR